MDSFYFILHSDHAGYWNLTPSTKNRLFIAVFILVCATIVISCIAVIGNWIVATIQHRTTEKRKKQSSERAREVMTTLSGTRPRTGQRRTRG